MPVYLDTYVLNVSSIKYQPTSQDQNSILWFPEPSWQLAKIHWLQAAKPERLQWRFSTRRPANWTHQLLNARRPWILFTTTMTARTIAMVRLTTDSTPDCSFWVYSNSITRWINTPGTKRSMWELQRVDSAKGNPTKGGVHDSQHRTSQQGTRWDGLFYVPRRQVLLQQWVCAAAREHSVLGVHAELQGELLTSWFLQSGGGLNHCRWITFDPVPCTYHAHIHIQRYIKEIYIIYVYSIDRSVVCFVVWLCHQIYDMFMF